MILYCSSSKQSGTQDYPFDMFYNFQVKSTWVSGKKLFQPILASFIVSLSYDKCIMWARSCDVNEYSSIICSICLSPIYYPPVYIVFCHFRLMTKMLLVSQSLGLSSTSPLCSL